MFHNLNYNMKKIKEQLEDKNVKFIRPVFVDILGRMLDFTIPMGEFEALIRNGKGFDGSSVEGFARTEESDLRFIPDIDTLAILPWEYKGIDHHEVAPSQHEIDLSYTNALKMADEIILTKYIVKKIAKKYGVYASFMPKPVAGINGNGMHLHLSLWKDSKNLFFDEEKQGLSDIARSYIAGLIKYGKDIQAGLNQWINSYKRLYPGYEAPTYLVWGTKNRSAYIRVPEYQKGKESATRIEIRSPDPACNPYLAISLIHAAGIQGIKERLKPPEPVEVDVFHLSASERKKLNIEELSLSLEKALEFFEKSELVKKTLPKHIYQKFIENKRIECNNFNKAVTDYEIKNYFGVLFFSQPIQGQLFHFTQSFTGDVIVNRCLTFILPKLTSKVSFVPITSNVIFDGSPSLNFDLTQHVKKLLNKLNLR